MRNQNQWLVIGIVVLGVSGFIAWLWTWADLSGRMIVPALTLAAVGFLVVAVWLVARGSPL